jgi:hypothetical protein
MPAGTGYMGGVASARQITMATVEVTLLQAPLSLDRGGVADALNPARWRLEVREPEGSIVRLAQTVVEVSSTVFQVVFDGPLDAPVTYRIFVEGITDMSGVAIDPSQTFADFLSFLRFRVAPDEEGRAVSFDLANPQVERDAEGQPLARYSTDETGDWRNDHGTAQLRKRILRRAASAFGSFFHLPDYGFAEPLKALLRPSRLARMQARAQAQVLREPDVARARVTVTSIGAGVVRASIRAVDTTGKPVIVTQDIDLADLGGLGG